MMTLSIVYQMKRRRLVSLGLLILGLLVIGLVVMALIGFGFEHVH